MECSGKNARADEKMSVRRTIRVDHMSPQVPFMETIPRWYVQTVIGPFCPRRRKGG